MPPVDIEIRDGRSETRNETATEATVLGKRTAGRVADGVSRFSRNETE